MILKYKIKILRRIKMKLYCSFSTRKLSRSGRNDKIITFAIAIFSFVDQSLFIIIIDEKFLYFQYKRSQS
jgi:hypothetical protein